MSIRRRTFLAGLGAFGAGTATGAFSHLFPLPSPQVGPDWSPGEETSLASTCLLCPARCGIRGRIVDGTLVRIDGNPLHPVSRGGLCPKGRAGLQMLYHPGRLDGPRRGAGPAEPGQLEPIGWPEALDRVHAALAEAHEAGATDRVVFVCGHVTGLMRELLERFVEEYGAAPIAWEDYGDGSDLVSEFTDGRAEPLAFDIDDADLVLSFGAALDEAWWCPPLAARARAGRDRSVPRFVQVDTRLSRTAIAADEWLPVRTGTFGDLALGIAYVLLKEGLYDEAVVHRAASGFESWTDERGRRIPGFRRLALDLGRPDRVAERTGLPVERIVALAKRFGTARRPVAVWDQATTWRRGGVAQALAIHALNVIRGRVGRRGGVLHQPPLPVPALGADRPVRERPRAPEDWLARLEQSDEPPLAVFFYNSNPLASHHDPQRVARLLATVPLVVSFSPFADATARAAHFVLPDHTYLERWQDAPAPPVVPYAVWSVVRPLSPPLRDTRATGDVLLELAKRLGDALARPLPEGPMERLVAERGRRLAAVRSGSPFVPDFRRGELAELERRGWWIPHGLDEATFWHTVLDAGGWFDPLIDDEPGRDLSRRPDGRLALFPLDARERLGQRNDHAPAFGFEDPAPVDEAQLYPLQLVPYRVSTLSSGNTAFMPWLLERIGVVADTHWDVWVELHPDTAAELGLRDGQRVEVISSAGRFRAHLRTLPGAQPGVAHVPYGLHDAPGGWGRLETANPLAAVGGARDVPSGMPDWSSTRVRIVAA